MATRNNSFGTAFNCLKPICKMPLNGNCLLCSAQSRRLWCAACDRDLLRHEYACRICAARLGGAGVCGRCLAKKPLFRRTVTAFSYAYPLKFVIRAFKYNNHPEYAATFAAIMAERLAREEMPEVIVPVPLYKKRQQARGYNQSGLLARRLARLLGGRSEQSLCYRAIDTVPQSTLPIKTRKKNIKGAFRLNTRHPPRHLAIVDDVVTTGATVSELALTFKRAGSEIIDVWAIARAG